MARQTAVAVRGDRKPSTNLIKHDIASALRNEVVVGHLLPGQRIIEGSWARHFGVAQASVREAINILQTQGFARKEPGRSARVTQYSAADVTRIYQVRGVLEGLAARLCAKENADLISLTRAIDGMRAAVATSDMKRLIENDLQFHLGLCRSSGNSILTEQADRLLIPFFAFVQIRATSYEEVPTRWAEDVDTHQRTVDLIRDGEGRVAEQYVVGSMERFIETARQVWMRSHSQPPLRTNPAQNRKTIENGLGG